MSKTTFKSETLRIFRGCVIETGQRAREVEQKNHASMVKYIIIEASTKCYVIRVQQSQEDLERLVLDLHLKG